MFLVLALVCVAAISRVVDGQLLVYSPLVAYLLSWTVVLSLYILKIVPLTAISGQVIALIALGIATTTIGYALTRPKRGLDAGSLAIGSLAAHERAAAIVTLTRLIRLLLLVGGPLAILYVAYIVNTYNASNLSSLLVELRTDLGSGQIPAGFRFFYLAEIIAPAALVLATLDSGRRRTVYVMVGLVALLMLILTSGRSNLLRTSVWCVASLSVGYRPRAVSRHGIRVVFAAACVLVFVLLGNAIGKTYENSALSHVEPRYGVSETLAVPYLYATGSIPTLGAIVEEPDEDHLRGATIRPVIQIAQGLGLAEEAPGKIQAFRAIPYPFNLSTYMGPAYQDAGTVGVALVSLLHGVAAGAAMIAVRRTRMVTDRLIVGLLFVSMLLSPVDLYLNNLSVCLQLALLIGCRRLERHERIKLLRSRTSTSISDALAHH